MGWGGRLFEAGCSSTFSSFSLDAYSRWALIGAQGPHSHILMTAGGGVVQRIFLALTFLAKRDFFGSRKQHRDFFGYCIFHQLKSTIT